MIPRLGRLFAPDGRCLNVAVDHGMFGEGSMLTGIEDMPVTIETLVRAGPDAIQLSPGHGPLLQAVSGRRKPALVMRTDIANVYGADPGSSPFSELAARAVERAVKLDAACVVVNILLIPGRSDLYLSCIRNVTALRADCDRVAMPLMVEPLALQRGVGGYGIDGDVDKIVPLVRQAVELGADVVKADPTEDLADYHRVIEAASGRPVLPRGGGKVPDDEVLRRTEELMRQGASGIVYGRNIIQHRDPASMTRALMSVVHDGATAEQALALPEKAE